MLKLRTRILTAAAVALGLAVLPAIASAGEGRDAERECKEAMIDRHNADDFHGVTSHKKSRGYYKVTGYADRHNRYTEEFTCIVYRGRVDDLRFMGWQKEHGSDDEKAAIVGGVLLAAAIASAANDHDDDHDYEYRSYNRYEDRDTSWHPTRDVTCYRNLRQCYETGHGYSAYWTRHEFH